MRFNLTRLPLPHIRSKRTKLFNQLKRPLCIIDRCCNFSTMADNTCILQQTLHVIIIKPSHFIEIKTNKSRSKIFPLTQNGQPREARLKAFQTDFLK